MLDVIIRSPKEISKPILAHLSTYSSSVFALEFKKDVLRRSNIGVCHFHNFQDNSKIISSLERYGCPPKRTLKTFGRNTLEATWLFLRKSIFFKKKLLKLMKIAFFRKFATIFSNFNQKLRQFWFRTHIFESLNNFLDQLLK